MWVYKYICVCANEYMNVCIDIRTCVCMCVNIYMYTCVYKYICT